MKANLHPTWFNDAKVTCSCGATFQTGSTLENIRVEICSQCHPFYTGQQRFVDTLGQVEKFQSKNKKAEAKMVEKQKIVQAREAKTKVEKAEKLSLRDLLMQARKTVNS